MTISPESFEQTDSSAAVAFAPGQYRWINPTKHSSLAAIAITPFDTGAAGDGVTDDSAAFTRALASGRPVRVPGGYTYVVGGIQLTGNQILYGDPGNHPVIIPSSINTAYVFSIKGVNSRIAGFKINDNGNNVAKTTLVSGGTLSSTSITVVTPTSGQPLVVGQRYTLRLDDGTRASGWITALTPSGANTVVTLSNALPSASTSTSALFNASFGTIYVTTGSQAFTIGDMIHASSWAAYHLDNPLLNGSPITTGLLYNIHITHGTMFGLVSGREVQNCHYTSIINFGAFQNTVTATGDGATTQFSLGGEKLWKPDSATVLVNGVAINNNGSVTTAGTNNAGTVIKVQNTKFAAVGMQTAASGLPANVPANDPITAVDNTAKTVTFQNATTGTLSSNTVIPLVGGSGNGWSVTTDGLKITFNTAPANGVPISITWGVHGADGYCYDATGSVASASTNRLSHCSFLGYNRSGYIGPGPNSSWSIVDCVFDSADQEALLLNDCALGTMTNVYIGAAPIGVSLINGAVATGTFNAAKIDPSLYNSGQAGVPISVDATSTFNGQYTQGAGQPPAQFGQQVITNNATSPPTPISANGLQLVATDGQTNRLEIDAFGAVNSLAFYRTDGTNASPTTLVLGDVIGQIDAFGYNGTAQSTSVAQIALVSDGTWTNASEPARIDFYTTPSGSTSKALSWRVTSTGGIHAVGVTGGDPGFQGINAASLRSNGVRSGGVWVLSQSGLTVNYPASTTGEVNLVAVQLPVMGANDAVEVWTLWTFTGANSTKSPIVRIGSSSGATAGGAALNVSFSAGTAGTYQNLCRIQNANATNVQVMFSNSIANPWSTTTNGNSSGAIQTSGGNAWININANLANSGDTIALNYYCVKVIGAGS